ncbi:MAG TPA: lipopolysaccharide kinase InaA family protein [Verrucomicrobiota bacterium]|nr:lipopolysaccharide kinase InaA family protein [Verrucomicrobiota bacterium]
MRIAATAFSARSGLTMSGAAATLRSLKTGYNPFLLPYANLAFFLSPKTWGQWPHEPCPPVTLPAEGFGVCAASSEDPACDDYVVERLREARVRCVRVDFSPESFGGFRERFLRRLLKEQFLVALHLVATRAEMEALTKPEGAERWRQFVRDTFDAFADAEFFEIGSTVNRRRWSGFNVPLFLRAWDIAWEEAQSRRVTLAGPNVTDFEPFYNIPILHALRRSGRLPAIHTNNLFVERATEPEAFDHKLLGHKLAPLLKVNTNKKAALLGAISRWAGVKRTFSMHVSWSLRRIERVLEDAEEQQADYVTRYCCLAAISGGLDRIYWGPLVGQREGLIDDGSTFFPDVFHVTFYGRANGTLGDYRSRPAFRAFATVNRFLPGTTFTRRIPATGPLEIVEFQSATHTFHVVWCRNGFCAEATKCYTPETLAAAEAHDRSGDKLATAPRLFTQQPVYLRWPKDLAVQPLSTPGVWPEVRLSMNPTVQYTPVTTADWHGLALQRIGDTAVETDTLLPHRFPALNTAETTTLRNKRNRVWAVASPFDPQRKIVVKHFRPSRGIRGWLQRFKPGKALRSWNGAHELLRRGVPTPQPVAWLEHPRLPRESESYYLCEAFEGGASARQAFYAFNEGKTEFLGIPAEKLYCAIAEVIAKMHGRGVFFRDLSAGNLLLRRDSNGGAEFSLIDTARARIGGKGISKRQRLADLMRLCHPLNWNGREQLLRVYFAAANIRFAPWMRLAFHYYDWKHRIKKKLRRR